MGKKRKRPVKDGRTRPAGLSQPSSSTTVPETAVGSGNDEAVSTISGDSSRPLSHPVLSLYYNRVVSLRQFLLSQIPVSSRSRRKRIGSVGRAVCTKVTGGNGQVGNSSSDDNGFATFLDTTLVGVLKETPPTVSRERQRDLVAFTQSQSQSQSQSKSQLSNSDSGSSCAQSEVCWTGLFSLPLIRCPVAFHLQTGWHVYLVPCACQPCIPLTPVATQCITFSYQRLILLR